MKNPIEYTKRRTAEYKKHKEAGTGEVGIFWIYGKEFIQDSVPFPMGDEIGGDWVNGKNDHYSWWKNVVRLFPEFRNKEYDEIPRGRVVYDKKTKKFFVYGSKEFVNSSKQRSMVLRNFNLSARNTVFKQDEHYELQPSFDDMIDEEFFGSEE